MEALESHIPEDFGKLEVLEGLLEALERHFWFSCMVSELLPDAPLSVHLPRDTPLGKQFGTP